MRQNRVCSNNGHEGRDELLLRATSATGTCLRLLWEIVDGSVVGLWSFEGRLRPTNSTPTIEMSTSKSARLRDVRPSVRPTKKLYFRNLCHANSRGLNGKCFFQNYLAPMKAFSCDVFVQHVPLCPNAPTVRTLELCCQLFIIIIIIITTTMASSQ